MVTDPIITFENVGVAFGEEQIYDHLSFDVRRGQFVCILGPSGCGKSTLLRMIGGLLEMNMGRVTVDGRTPRDTWPEIAFVFQSPRLVPWRTALDNVLLGMELRFGPGDKERRRARATELRGPRRRLAQIPVYALRWRAPARCDRARARGRSQDRADGRAIFGARP
ncbi:MAG: ATP-binding cassette domain-containing protein [Xanthobacteraceae bacterium]